MDTRAELIRQALERMAGVEGTAESGDGFVRATTGARGELRALRIDPRVYREPDAEALAREIVRTVAEAASDAERRAFDVAGVLVPDDAVPGEFDLAFDPMLRELEE